MKLSAILFLVFFVLSVSISAQELTKVWETDTVLDVPESVLFGDSVLYVSNVNGKPTQKNEMGYIAKLSLTGKVLKKEWAVGMNAPKGMGAFDNFLYIADIDRVLVVDLKNGETVQQYDFPEAEFLNDIAISESGRVYISDMHTNSIYIIHEEFSKKLISDSQLSWVNGLYCDGEKLYAGTSNGVFVISKEGKIVNHLIKDTGGIDGLEKVKEGVFLNSDWSGKVQLISAETKPHVLLNFEDDAYNAADIDFCKKEMLVYIPTFFGKTVAAYKLVKYD